MLAVDLSGSERFGTRKRFKSELASELAAVLAMSAIRNNDRVGAVLFTDRIEHVVPPRKGRRHALRLMRDLLVFEPEGTGTDIAAARWSTPARCSSHKAIIFVVSDFQAAELEQPLKLLAQRHDVVAVTVDDPSEQPLPDIGLARFVDPETGETLDMDTSDPDVRAPLRRGGGARSWRRARACCAASRSTRSRCTPTAAWWIRSSSSSARARRAAAPVSDAPRARSRCCSRRQRCSARDARRRRARRRRRASPCRPARRSTATR